MKPVRALKFSINILRHSKLRSWLTIVGIIIGVAAIVSIVSVGNGMQETVRSQLSGLGADIITITPGFTRAQGFGGFGGGGVFGDRPSTLESSLTRRDVQTLKSVSGISFINPIISGRAQMTYLAQNASVNVQGVDPLAWSNMITVGLDSGRYLGPSDSNSIVITKSLSMEIFKNEISVNKPVFLEGRLYRVVGILEDEGIRGRSVAYMPYFSAKDILGKETDIYDSISIKIADQNQLDSIAVQMESALMLSRHVTELKKDFTLTSSKAIQEQINQILGSFVIFLTGIAAVSLLVGAIGIANTMFTSVLEKTKEIGILKAIGARNKDIMMIFLFNSALLGLVGGIIGVALGYTGSNVLALILPSNPGARGGSQGITPIVTPEIVLVSMGVSVAVGIISGIIPAYRASKLKPVDALRYE